MKFITWSKFIVSWLIEVLELRVGPTESNIVNFLRVCRMICLFSHNSPFYYSVSHDSERHHAVKHFLYQSYILKKIGLDYPELFAISVVEFIKVVQNGPTNFTSAICGKLNYFNRYSNDSY